MNKYTRVGLICLGTAAFEYIDGLVTRSYRVTLPATAIFLIAGVIFLLIGDHKKKDSKMKLVTEFDLDQEVWAISNSNNGLYSNHDCTICKRTGKVTIRGEELTCPKCQGRSRVPRWAIEIRRGVVVQVDVVRTADRVARPEGWDNRNTYRLGHIGDGQIWPEEWLFATEEEAEAECNRRNELLKDSK